MSNLDPETLSITVKCLKCGGKFPSPIFMSPKSTFDSSVLENNVVQCTVCGQMTGCDKENFVARFKDGGFVGNDAL
ncbi:hypothetical protein MLC59_01965 [Marinobacter bryozoorum]|uniref:hypothetical protein n=1 Tax=Marinobacter bryozoorum TaxID=256324 RepID=UPI002004B619|nr:hypothetical protein [Marinobacter bryozoorum]MCK7542936.1 hypothetical protein [Marinobacter bryozoorum]